MATNGSSTASDRDEVVREDTISGHLNNLDESQQRKLKDIWKRFFDVVSDARGAAKAAASGGGAASTSDGPTKGTTAPTTADSAPEADTSKKEKGEQAQASPEQEAADLKKLINEHGPDKFYRAFWEYCYAEDPDALMLRFLRARKWDSDQAFKGLASTIKWRIENRVQEDIIAKGEEGLCEQEGVKKNLGMPKCYFHGTDRQGRPVIYARAKYHKASEQTNEEMKKYIIYWMETARTLLPAGEGLETCSVVVDLRGLGMSNVDWDVATMVLSIFQGNYPETLGHCTLWGAPTLFSGVWKIIKGMLDPAVKEKIAFASNDKDIAEFIDPKNLEKDLGGTSSWRYDFSDPVAGENDHMKDAETKEKRLKDFKAAVAKFEDSTEAWIGGDSSAGKERREKHAKELLVRRLDLDPYVRGMTVFAREGTVVGDGRIKWHYDHGRNAEYGTSANETASELSIEDPPSRPENKDSEDVVLSSDEDTVSETDDSEEDILDDPNHHHHNSVAVGFAKFGDNVANKFSKIGPGPSLHEKRRQKRAKRHEEHQARREKKLEMKRKRIEAEQRHQEELREKEEADGGTEQDVADSYQAYLARIAYIPIGAAMGAAQVVAQAAGATASNDPATTAAADEKTVEERRVKVDDKGGVAANTTEKPKKASPPPPKAKSGGLVDFLPLLLAVALAGLAIYLGKSYVQGGGKATSTSTTTAHHKGSSAAAVKETVVASTIKNKASSTTATASRTAVAVKEGTPSLSSSIIIVSPSAESVSVSSANANANAAAASPSSSASASAVTSVVTVVETKLVTAASEPVKSPSTASPSAKSESESESVIILNATQTANAANVD